MKEKIIEKAKLFLKNNKIVDSEYQDYNRSTFMLSDILAKFTTELESMKPSDEEIERWATEETFMAQLDGDDAETYKIGLITGFKACRNGLIPKE